MTDDDWRIVPGPGRPAVLSTALWPVPAMQKIADRTGLVGEATPLRTMPALI